MLVHRDIHKEYRRQSQMCIREKDNAKQNEFLESLKQEIDSFRKELKPIEQKILSERILSETPRSLQEIGDDQNVTREAIRQTEQRILKKFKTFLE